MKAEKAERRKNEQGAVGFDAFYAALYPGRWEGLKQALLAQKEGMEWSLGLEKPYRLDGASILAALSLAPACSGPCIDLCAAPGGKSLVLATLIDPAIKLSCNERSQERAGRLRRVMHEHLGALRAASLGYSSFDAAALCRKRPQSYQAILLDAPCSSERHVLASPTHLERWSPARTRHLAQAQWALLSSAYLMLQEGGSLCYATCSINPGENEAVIERLLKKYGQEARVIDPRPDMLAGLALARERGLDPTQAAALEELIKGAQSREQGIAILPDTSGGAGPIYLCRVEKGLRPPDSPL